MRFLVLGLLVWCAGSAAAQEPRVDAASAPVAELLTLEEKLAEVCKAGTDRLDAAAWAAWRRRGALLAGLAASARSRIAGRSVLREECLTRLAGLARLYEVRDGQARFEFRDIEINRPAIDRFRWQFDPKISAVVPPPGGGAGPGGAIAMNRPHGFPDTYYSAPVPNARIETPAVAVTPPPATAPIGPATAGPIPIIKSLFPWPPPAPSAGGAFSPDVVAGQLRVTTAGEVSDRLVTIIRATGYGELGYFLAPGGFALVTRCERLDGETGKPLVANRWCSDNRVAEAGVGFGDMIRDMFKFVRTPGHNRIIVFVLTSESVETPRKSDAETYQIVSEWSVSGRRFLPAQVRALPVGPEHALLVLVYEFEKSDGAVQYVVPGRWELHQHLASIGAVLKPLP